jgi:NAD(P)-dependent dehydrogenase (short-subunit alcohol dehydrogenase family)
MASMQQPIQSGFGPESTAQDVLNGVRLDGKIAIVTGGYSGLGLETTRALAESGARVIVPARSADKAKAALHGLRGVEQATLDLLDPESIAGFARQVVQSRQPVHMVVNNAGIMATPLTRDSRGYESQFSANHLGHFQLIAQLWPALRQADGARVVSVSSRGHHFGDVDSEDPNYLGKQYDKWKAYGQSKTANILFALELDRRAKEQGVRAFSLHPGRIMSTGLIRFLNEGDLRAAGVLDDKGRLTTAATGKNPAQGAATSVWCATSTQLKGMGGVYCEDVDVAPVAQEGDHGKCGVKSWAVNLASAERLWALSEALTGLSFKP